MILSCCYRSKLRKSTVGDMSEELKSTRRLSRTFKFKCTTMVFNESNEHWISNKQPWKEHHAMSFCNGYAQYQSAIKSNRSRSQIYGNSLFVPLQTWNAWETMARCARRPSCPNAPCHQNDLWENNKGDVERLERRREGWVHGERDGIEFEGNGRGWMDSGRRDGCKFGEGEEERQQPMQ